MSKTKSTADVIFVPNGGEPRAYLVDTDPRLPQFVPEDYSNHNKEGLSIMVSSRVDKNTDSNIFRLLDSAVQFVDPEDYGRIEFILKYDFDDQKRPDPSEFHRYPFAVKVFIYERGEGRHYNHHFSEFGFANRNTSFRWAMSMADDFYFTRHGFYKEIEAIKDEYMVIGYTRPTFELNAACGVYKQCFPVNFDYDNGIGGYCPLMTANLIEIAQNMGWQSNIDAWIVLLEATLYQKYQFLIWKKLDQFYFRGGDYGLGDTPTRKGWDIYNNLTITGARLPKNKYLFKLIEQQAANIYLNIVYGNREPDAEAKAKVAELRAITPLFTPDEQKPGSDWIPVDACRYENPPIMDWYQIG